MMDPTLKALASMSALGAADMRLEDCNRSASSGDLPLFWHVEDMGDSHNGLGFSLHGALMKHAGSTTGNT